MAVGLASDFTFQTACEFRAFTKISLSPEKWLHTKAANLKIENSFGPVVYLYVVEKQKIVGTNKQKLGVAQCFPR